MKHKELIDKLCKKCQKLLKSCKIKVKIKNKRSKNDRFKRLKP